MKSVPFEFVLEALSRINPSVKPMFGCHALYRDEKILLILRNRKDNESDNGVWLATTHEHHASLKEDFPSMRSIRLLGGKITSWQNLPLDSSDFEEAVMRACELVLKGDRRIGKVPGRYHKK